jgi:hypothetical protein
LIRPVALGPIRGFIVFVTAILQDIELRMTYVPEELEESIWKILNHYAKLFVRNLVQDLIDRGVCFSTLQVFYQSISQLGIGHH